MASFYMPEQLETSANPKRPMKEPLPERKCLNCPTKFIPYRPTQYFCKPNCRGEYYWKTHEIVPKGEVVS